MREDYKITKPTEALSVQIEADVIEILKAMEGQTKLTVSELANTAIRRFISAHKDFMPTDFYETRVNKLNQR